MHRLLAAVVVLGLVVVPVAAGPVPAGVSAQEADGAPNPCVGTVTETPDAPTLLSIQGARGSAKTVAMVVGIRENGDVIGIHNGTAHGRWWVYDVDKLENGNLLLSTTEPGLSVIESLDPATGEHVRVWRFPDVLDSHDADLRDGELLFNDMSRGGGDRVVVYNVSRDEVVWEYRFANHTDQFPREGGGEFDQDWTHNNDVEWIGDDLIMVSVRNFDQVVAINRSTKQLEWTLGADDEYGILNEQHNPDFFADASGTPTVLVADSLNDRVVEYARVEDDPDTEPDGDGGLAGTGWNRTWSVTGFHEPRDADRLPNGNTLVADRRGDRLVEISPEGEVVWEFYAPWQPYDAERIGTGDESSPPSMRTVNATGRHNVTGGSAFGPADLEACYAFLTSVDSTRLLPGVVDGTTGESDTGDATAPGNPESTDTTAAAGPVFATPYAVLVAVVFGGFGFLVVSRRIRSD